MSGFKVSDHNFRCSLYVNDFREKYRIAGRSKNKDDILPEILNKSVKIVNLNKNIINNYSKII